MYMNLLSVSLNIWAQEGRDGSYFIFVFQNPCRIYLKIHQWIFVRFLFEKSLREFYLLLETSRMCNCFDLSHISSIVFKVFNAKHLLSSTAQKEIKLEMVGLLFLVQKWAYINSVIGKKWTH